MKNRTVVLGIAAGLLLAVPAIVAAQESLPIAASWAPFDSPSFLGGSGRTVPAGAVEVVRAEPGASVILPDGAEMPLSTLLGNLFAPEPGTVIRGCCEVVAPGGVSYHVPAGARAGFRESIHGGIALESVSGSLFAKNVELTLVVTEGGRVGASDQGKFLGIAGDGRVGRQDRWVTWKSTGGPKTLDPQALKSHGYKDCGDDEKPVSPSRGGKGGKDDDDDDDDHGGKGGRDDDDDDDRDGKGGRDDDDDDRGGRDGKDGKGGKDDDRDGKKR